MATTTQAVLPAPAPALGRRSWPRRHVRPVAASVALALLASAGALRALQPRDVAVVEAVTGIVQDEVAGPGTVQSRRSVGLSARLTGVIARVDVDVGDTVKAGQVLATLDAAELEARLRAAVSAHETAGHDVAAAEAALDDARAKLALARLTATRARALEEPGFLAPAEADEAHAAVLSAEAAERAAGAVLRARRSALLRLADEERIARTVLSYATLTSPMDGVVTRRALEPGSSVSPGSVVLQVVDAEALWVATLVDQSVAGRIHVGQEATIRLRTGQEHDGRVARIALEADPVTRELEVDVAFDVRPERFAIHEDADVTIYGDERVALVVPLSAVTPSADGPVVTIVEDGRARSRRVLLGATSAGRAEIRAGLAPGDAVIAAPAGLREGQRVAIAGGDG